MMSVWVSTVCVVLAVVLVVRAQHSAVARLYEMDRRYAVHTAWEPSITLVLSMIAVAIEQGTSIPHALIGVGETLSGSTGNALSKVGYALLDAVPWQDAWIVAQRKDASANECLGIVRESLQSAWLEGAAPLAHIQATIERIGARERARIEQEASQLSVRLLLPTGLCFLPSFVCIAVVPAIASFIQ